MYNGKLSGNHLSTRVRLYENIKPMNTKVRKSSFSDGCSRFKFSNFGLALKMVLTFYTSVAKGLKLKVKTFWELILTFVEAAGDKPGTNLKN